MTSLCRMAIGAMGLAFVVACDSRPYSSHSPALQPTAALRAAGKLALGSPELTGGIPGDGPLTVDQVRQWLAQEDVHAPLEVLLPLGLADAADRLAIPSDNPLTLAKIELGRQLFFDRRLSEFDTMACATCHLPEQNYSIHGVAPGSNLNPPVCFNRVLSQRQSWDGRDETLEAQVSGPVANPLEMAMTPDAVVAKLQSSEAYRLQFQAIFGQLDFIGVSRALASFQRALVTGPSPWDYHRLLAPYEGRALESLSQEESVRVAELRAGAAAHPMSAEAIRGEALFFSERTQCGACHAGPNLTDEAYHNVGAGMDEAEPHKGRFQVTHREEDRGAFKTPTLRNVARTSPYMHNGQFRTLQHVVEWFDRGGSRHPNQDRRVQPLQLTPGERRDLIAFLESLTGDLPPVETARLPE